MIRLIESLEISKQPYSKSFGMIKGMDNAIQNALKGLIKISGISELEKCKICVKKLRLAPDSNAKYFAELVWF